MRDWIKSKLKAPPGIQIFQSSANVSNVNIIAIAAMKQI